MILKGRAGVVETDGDLRRPSLLVSDLSPVL